MATNYYVDDYAKLVRDTVNDLRKSSGEVAVPTFLFGYPSEVNGDTNIIYPCMLMEPPSSFQEINVGQDGEHKIIYTTEFWLYDTYTIADMQEDRDLLQLERAEKWGNIHRTYHKFTEALLSRDNINTVTLLNSIQPIDANFVLLNANDSPIGINFTLVTRHPFGCAAEL